jgi:site-specific DNA-adenine methylase
MCSTHYSKAFDTVHHLKMWNNVKSMGTPDHLIVLIRNLYTEQEAKVQAEQSTTVGSQNKNE